MNKEQKRILHVDDDPQMRKFIAVILSDIADVTPATSLQRARELVKETRYDLVLVDSTLPDGSGSELINELARQDPSIPIIVLSTHEISNTLDNVKQVFQKTHFDKKNLTDAVRAQIR